MSEPKIPSHDFAATVRAFTRAAAGMRNAIEAFGRQMVVVGQILDQAMWDAYEEAGYPYGPNHAGRERWLRERGEIARYQERIDEIEITHAMHAELRRIVHDRELG